MVTVRDDKGNLIATVYNNVEKRALEVYSCEKVGLDEVENILKLINANNYVQK